MSAAALVCCFVPGFNSLGYYSALLMGALGSLLGLSLGALEAHRLQVGATSSHRLMGSVACSAWILLAPPLVILSLNALFVPNCDLVEGAAFYAMSAGLGILFATQIGAVCTLVFGGRARGVIGALVVGLLWTAKDCLHLFTDPPIFVFNPFFGFFSGAIYDDVIAIDGRFLWFRVASLVQVAWMWSFMHLGWHEGEWSIAGLRARGVRSNTRLWATFALLSFLCGGLYGARSTIGYEIDQAAIERALGGRLESDTITLIYDRTSIEPDRAERLMWDARFRLHQLGELLEEEEIAPFTLFLYGSPDQKRRLMGASRVQLAKPWLRQAHIHNSTYGNKTLAHEMAHVVLGMYSSAPLYVPARWGVLVNAGILEGAAVALEPPSSRFNVHEKSAAMRRLGLAPDLHLLLGPEGFWSQSASRSYTLTGSFLKWLHRKRGADAFKAIYGSGDFESVYAGSLDSLVSSWERWVDDQAVSAELLAWADYAYRGAGVFYRVCPLEIARLNDSAGRLLASGRDSEAVEVLEQIVDHLPQDPGSLLQLASLKAQTETPAALDALTEEVLAIEDLPILIRARFQELRADTRWRHGDTHGAEAIYSELSSLPLTPERLRLVRLKRDVSLSQDLEPVYGPYLLGGARDAQVDLLYLTEATSDLPREPIATYLLGRRTLQTGDAEGAIGPLKTSLALLEDDATRGAISLDTAQGVEAEAWRLLAHALLHTRALLDAEAAFARASHLSRTSEHRAMNLDWAARASWLRTHRELQEQGVF
jgi:tetratricopeptide (TPR) repeat protein